MTWGIPFALYVERRTAMLNQVAHLVLVAYVDLRLPPTWLTYWDRVTHICVSKLTIIGSDNGLSPGRRQAIIWTNAGIGLLVIEPLRTNFSEISIKIHTFSFKEMHLEMSSGKWRPFCLSLNVLMAFLWKETTLFSGEKPPTSFQPVIRSTAAFPFYLLHKESTKH